MTFSTVAANRLVHSSGSGGVAAPAQAGLDIDAAAVTP